MWDRGMHEGLCRQLFLFSHTVSNRRQTSLIIVAHSSRGEFSWGFCCCLTLEVGCVSDVLLWHSTIVYGDCLAELPMCQACLGPRWRVLCFRALDSCPRRGVRRGLFHFIHEAPFSTTTYLGMLSLRKTFFIVLRPSLIASLVFTLWQRNMWP